MSICKDPKSGEVINLDERKMACDEEHQYYCGKDQNYEFVYGHNSLEECKDFYCCDEPIQEVPDLKCTIDNINLDVPFGNGNCFPIGWVQNNDDCWIDSALYSMFGSTGTADFFSDLLHNIRNNPNDDIKNLAINIRKYLVGLTNREFSCNKVPDTGRPPLDEYGRILDNGYLCKQHYKNKISENIIEIAINVLDKHPDAVNAQFNKRLNGDIGTGSVGILFETIASLSDDILYINPSQRFDWNCTKDIPDRKFIKSVVKKLKDIDTESEIVIFDINGVSPIQCKDVTRLTELSNSQLVSKSDTNYELLGIVFGIGVHYTSAVKCPRGEAGVWRLYDMGISAPDECNKNTLSGQNPANLITKNTFNNSENIVLIYRKINEPELPVAEVAELVGGSIYNTIINPVTGRKVNIQGKLGRYILHKYINMISN